MECSALEKPFHTCSTSAKISAYAHTPIRRLHCQFVTAKPFGDLLDNCSNKLFALFRHIRWPQYPHHFLVFQNIQSSIFLFLYLWIAWLKMTMMHDECIQIKTVAQTRVLFQNSVQLGVCYPNESICQLKLFRHIIEVPTLLHYNADPFVALPLDSVTRYWYPLQSISNHIHDTVRTTLTSQAWCSTAARFSLLVLVLLAVVVWLKKKNVCMLVISWWTCYTAASSDEIISLTASWKWWLARTNSGITILILMFRLTLRLSHTSATASHNNFRSILAQNPKKECAFLIFVVFHPPAARGLNKPICISLNIQQDTLETVLCHGISGFLLLVIHKSRSPTVRYRSSFHKSSWFRKVMLLCVYA